MIFVLLIVQFEITQSKTEMLSRTREGMDLRCLVWYLGSECVNFSGRFEVLCTYEEKEEEKSVTGARGGEIYMVVTIRTYWSIVPCPGCGQSLR